MTAAAMTLSSASNPMEFAPGIEPRGGNDRGDAAQHSHHDEDHHGRLADVDARQLRRLRIATHGKNVAAELGDTGQRSDITTTTTMRIRTGTGIPRGMSVRGLV